MWLIYLLLVIVLIVIFYSVISFVVIISKGSTKESKKLGIKWDSYKHFLFKNMLSSTNEEQMDMLINICSKRLAEDDALINSHIFDTISIFEWRMLDNKINEAKKIHKDLLELKNRRLMELEKNIKEKNIVALCGVMGSGKDYTSNKLRETTPSSTIINFTLKIRTLLSKIFNVDLLDEVVYEKWKIKNRYIIDNFSEVLKEEFGKNIWVEKLIDSIHKTEFKTIIIPDVRFKVEVEALQALGARFLFCDYKSERYAIHPEKPQEILACKLLELGYQEGQEINYADLTKVIKDL